MNMAYTVKKCRHLHDKYIYLYECLPNKGWAVVVYEDDDDTMESSQYFTDWTEALHEYNRIKNDIM